MPEPDSPTMPSVLPLLDGVAQAGHRLDEAVGRREADGEVLHDEERLAVVGVAPAR